MSSDIRFDGVPQKRTIKVGTVTTVDVETGEVVSERSNAFTVLPPRHGCRECETDHAYDQPHNQQSLTYQYQFYGKNGRWPTWTDAMSHCPEPVQIMWRKMLVETIRKKGMAIPDDLCDSGSLGGRTR